MARGGVVFGVALSLMLAVATGVLWLRGQNTGDVVILERADEERDSVRRRETGVVSGGGVIRYFVRPSDAARTLADVPRDIRRAIAGARGALALQVPE
jgi:hypothetical protein